MGQQLFLLGMCRGLHVEIRVLAWSLAAVGLCALQVAAFFLCAPVVENTERSKVFQDSQQP